MTRVYFVRHAQPDHAWRDDRTRPLTEEGRKDAAIVLDFLKDKKIDALYCSPYRRSMDTVAGAAAFFKKEIVTDERLREREGGQGGNNHGMFRKRWADHDFGCEDFLRIIDWMPYIIELDFEGGKPVGRQEHCRVEKEYKGNQEKAKS